MIETTCTGTPYQIGLGHGKTARNEVLGSIGFYNAYFMRQSKMDWDAACAAAEMFLPKLNRDWPQFVDEMKGVADGAQVPFKSILALNARTEISMGLMTDGCTSLAWKEDDQSLLGQNWDWVESQRDNLIIQHIKQQGKPDISQVTEGGIIGKIGLNSAGVGVALNAIRYRGVDYDRLPCHLALRAVLESTSRADAIDLVESQGIASAAHLLIADPTGATSIESSSQDIVKIESQDGKLAHTNHFLKPRGADQDPGAFLPDSHSRMERVTALMSESKPPLSKDVLDTILKDEDNAPFAINRSATAEVPASSLFSIVMDVTGRQAWVKIGQPTTPKREFHFEFS